MGKQSNLFHKRKRERGIEKWKHEGSLSTAVGQVVACAPVMQRAQVQSLVGTSFLGEVVSEFSLTCKTNAWKL